MKVTHIAFFLALLSVFPACTKKVLTMPEKRIGRQDASAREKKKETPPVKEGELVPLGQDTRALQKDGVLDIASIDRRLETFRQRLAKWNGLTDSLFSLTLVEQPERLVSCRKSLEKTISAYSLLREKIASSRTEDGASRGSGEDVRQWDAYSAEIEYHEKGCSVFYSEENKQVKDATEQIRVEVGKALEPLLMQLATQGRFLEAGQLWDRLKTQAVNVSAETKKVYAKGLLRDGRIEEAYGVLQGLRAKEDKNTATEDAVLMADIFFALGRVDQARKQCRDLIRDVTVMKQTEQWVAGHLDILEHEPAGTELFTAYQDLLRSYLAFDGRNVPPSAREKAKGILAGGVNSPFARGTVNLLRKMNQDPSVFYDASGFKGGGADETVEPKKESQEEAMAPKREEEKKTPTEIMEQSPQHPLQGLEAAEHQKAGQWIEGVKLLESRKYDEAITLFKGLFATEYDAQARQKVRESENQAAAEMRGQAATIYSKGRTTANPAKKEELYLESYRLLKDARNRYPQADISEKIEQNLRSVEAQLRELNPSIIP